MLNFKWLIFYSNAISASQACQAFPIRSGPGFRVVLPGCHPNEVSSLPWLALTSWKTFTCPKVFPTFFPSDVFINNAASYGITGDSRHQRWYQRKKEQKYIDSWIFESQAKSKSIVVAWLWISLNVICATNSDITKLLFHRFHYFPCQSYAHRNPAAVL